MSKINDNQIKHLLERAIEAKEKGESLGKVFSACAKKYNMAKGSVRNVYYNALKKAENDLDFRRRVLGGKTLSAEKIVEFKDKESDELLKNILTGVTFGKSVRRVILEKSGDEKTALRYQNKYRNLLIHDKQRVERVMKEVKGEYGRCYDPYDKKQVSDVGLVRLKREINSFCDKIAQSVREENLELKEKLKFYQNENILLKAQLEKAKVSPVDEYFTAKKLIKQTTKSQPI